MKIIFLSPNKKLFKSDKMIYNPDKHNFKVLTNIFRFYRNRNSKIKVTHYLKEN